MDDLPDLPFEKVLSYMSLEDRLKARAVSRRWYQKISNFKTTSLFYSNVPSGFIHEKSRLVSGAFVQNYICSARFEWFFNTFSRSILANLKQLRLCDLRLDLKNRKAFTCTLNSFGGLQELALIRTTSETVRTWKLNLPMLHRIHFEWASGIQKLTLNAPRLREVRLKRCSFLKLVLVHTDSVETLIIDRCGGKGIDIKKLKNLKYLWIDGWSGFSSTFLFGLGQLKEIHLAQNYWVSDLFEQKQRHGLADLQIYLCGLCLNGPDDPAIRALSMYLEESLIGHWTENHSRLADQIMFLERLAYRAVEHVAPELTVNVLRRCTDLRCLSVSRPIQDTQRFLDLLKSLRTIDELWIQGDQPQDLFDRLPEHCEIQRLIISGEVSDFGFLSRLKHLTVLETGRSTVNTDTLRKIFEELQFLCVFKFSHDSRKFHLQRVGHSNEFRVGPSPISNVNPSVSNLKAAMQFFLDNINMS